MKCTKCKKSINVDKDFYVFLVKSHETYCKKCYDKPEIYEMINQ